MGRSKHRPVPPYEVFDGLVSARAVMLAPVLLADPGSLLR